VNTYVCDSFTRSGTDADGEDELCGRHPGHSRREGRHQVDGHSHDEVREAAQLVDKDAAQSGPDKEAHTPALHRRPDRLIAGVCP